MPEVATLTLREAHRSVGGGKTERSYSDFYVSGIRLLDFLGWQDADYITPLGWGPAKYQADAVAELLQSRKPSLSTGRTQLYVCPECGDIGCGAVTTRIERVGDLIVWGNFDFENDSEEPRLSEFVKIAPIYFEAAPYCQILSAFKPHSTSTT